LSSRKGRTRHGGCKTHTRTSRAAGRQQRSKEKLAVRPWKPSSGEETGRRCLKKKKKKKHSKHATVEEGPRTSLQLAREGSCGVADNNLPLEWRPLPQRGGRNADVDVV